MKTQLKLKLIWIICFAIYVLINAYVGLCLWQFMAHQVGMPVQIAFIFLFVLLSISLVIGKIGVATFPGKFCNFCFRVGLYWLVALYYFLLYFLFVDSVHWVARIAGFSFPASRYDSSVGYASLLLIVFLLLYGTWQGQKPRIKKYDLTINKPGNLLQQLNIAVVSDMHLGLFMNRNATLAMLKLVDQIKPDIVLFAGDMIDETMDCFANKELAVLLRTLTPRFGVYGVLGNHEYIWGHAEKAIQHLEQAGIIILRDSYIKIADSFYLVGRDDKVKKMVSGQSRRPLTELMVGINTSLPIIVMDHQPGDSAESQWQGVDLQLSGHTHAGQLFPFNLVTKLIYKVDYGYLHKEKFHLIVSSGFGCSGPPVRVGSTPEVVQVRISFDHPSS